MVKVLITGGAGYIGSELVYTLVQHPEVEKVVIYDNLSNANFNLFIGLRKIHNPQKVELVKADILDSRNLKKALEDIDVVYHLAAFVNTPFSDNNPHSFEQINNWGTAQVVDAVEQSDVKKFIFTGSVSVYGSSENKVSEQSPLNPKTYYGISKKRAEEHLERLAGKTETHIIRLGNVYGYSKNIRIQSVINKMMFDANFHKRIKINGSGNQKRAFIYIKNAVNILASFLNKTYDKKVFNAVDNNYSINEVVSVLKEIYPELEMIYVNQHLPMRSIVVEPSPDFKHLKLQRDFKQNLLQYKEMFTF
jgi:UDP-glucose 4-epimerase